MNNATKNPKPKRLTIDISPDEHCVLKKVAADRGISMRQLVVALLEREVFAKAG